TAGGATTSPGRQAISGGRPSTTKPARRSAPSTAGAAAGTYSRRGVRPRARNHATSAATSSASGTAPSAGTAKLRPTRAVTGSAHTAYSTTRPVGPRDRLSHL